MIKVINGIIPSPIKIGSRDYYPSETVLTASSNVDAGLAYLVSDTALDNIFLNVITKVVINNARDNTATGLIQVGVLIDGATVNTTEQTLHALPVGTSYMTIVDQMSGFVDKGQTIEVVVNIPTSNDYQLMGDAVIRYTSAQIMVYRKEVILSV